MMSTVVEALSRDDKKIDPVPTWDESTSFEGWKKEIKVWSKSKGRQERKTQMMIEYLKKDPRKGIKELVVNEFIENESFQYESTSAIDNILQKIKEYIDDTKWNKTVAAVKEFDELERKDGEDSKTFVTRFTSMETKLKNISVEMPKMWLSAYLLKKAKIPEMKKHNDDGIEPTFVFK